MKKILIIGKKSFIGSYLKIYLSKFFKVDNYTFEFVMKKKNNFFNNYSHVINTAIHKNYINNRYLLKFDLDRKFILKFKKVNFYYIYLNSRKIYLPKENIREDSIVSPIGNYGRNKFKTEVFLKKKVNKKLVSLRISNIIGKRKYNNTRNNHKLFLDNFLKFKKKKNKITIHNDFKDFISIDQFSRVIYKIIKFGINGTYNVSIAEKIYVSEIVKWLDKNFMKKVRFIEASKDSFTLCNKKILKKIKIVINKNQLKLFCKNLI
jgi:dTDP-4-dehydrorhamnose reductase